MPNHPAVLDAETKAGERAPFILSGPAGAPDFPDWFREQQRGAWQQFEGMRMPVRKDQPWRFSSVDRLELAPFHLPSSLTEAQRTAVLERSRGLEKVAGRLIFADDQLIERDALPDKLRERGVIFQPLERTMVEHADLFRKHFMAQPATLGSAKFSALHQAHVRSGAFLFVPRGVEIDEPIEIF